MTRKATLNLEQLEYLRGLARNAYKDAWRVDDYLKEMKIDNENFCGSVTVELFHLQSLKKDSQRLLEFIEALIVVNFYGEKANARSAK